MTPVETVEENRDQSKKVFGNCVFVSVTFKRLGTTRKVSTSKFEVDADKRYLKATKEIFKSDKFKAIKSLDGQVRRYLDEISLPAKGMCRGGIFPVPAILVAQADEQLTKDMEKRKVLVEEFMTEYGETDADGNRVFLQKAQGDLRALANPNDYPSVEAVASSFDMAVEYINMGVPDALQSISQSIFERESQKQAAKVSEAAEEVKIAMRAGLKQMFDHLKDRLEPDEDGKPKKFHYTLIDKLKGFLNLFDAKNVADDQELAEIVRQSKLIMEGVDPKNLRENTEMREYVLQNVNSLSGTLDKMVVTGATRVILADEDEEDDNVSEAASAA